MGAFPVAEAVPTDESHGDFRPSGRGVLARLVASVVLAGGVLALPLFLENVYDGWMAKAAIYAVIGLSINVITGHAGQLSLGHQGFVGIGAFMAAFVSAVIGGYLPDPENPVLPPIAIPTMDFVLGLMAAATVGALVALLLGLVALRIRGLYLALITLAFGLMAESTVFGIREFTGAGAGASAPRPATFTTEQAYVYLCLAVLGVFLFVDWRLVRSKGGRAIVALRNDERIAATLGVNATAFKLIAFAVAGFMAGAAGALFAHWNQFVQAADFVLETALIWVVMAVVGGLGSRAGVVIGSAFFAVFPLVLGNVAGGVSIEFPLVGLVIVETIAPLVGALLLLLTITLYPGGIGQQVLPFRRWLAGGPLVDSRHEANRLAGLPALIALIAGLALTAGELGWLFGILVGLAAAVAVGLATAFALSAYVRAYQRARRKARRGATRSEAGATAPVPATVTDEIERVASGVPQGEESAASRDGASSRSDPPDSPPPPPPVEAGKGDRVSRLFRRRG